MPARRCNERSTGSDSDGRSGQFPELTSAVEHGGVVASPRIVSVHKRHR